jgi:hypothetical protein
MLRSVAAQECRYTPADVRFFASLIIGGNQIGYPLVITC